MNVGDYVRVKDQNITGYIVEYSSGNKVVIEDDDSEFESPENRLEYRLSELELVKYSAVIVHDPKTAWADLCWKAILYENDEYLDIEYFASEEKAKHFCALWGYEIKEAS